MKRICVFCGSSDGESPVYKEAAVAMADALASQDCDLVYGGASIGVMGAIANAMLDRNRSVIGIIPDFLAKYEISHAGLTELRLVSTMHERKAAMADLSDGFVALPGGIGTMEELMEIATWQQLNQHAKPIGVLNTAGYYDKFFEFLQHASNQGFLKTQHLNNILHYAEPTELLTAMNEYATNPTAMQAIKV